MNASFIRSAVILGLLCCVGPFAVDMYLPALPAVAADLGSSVTAAQWTITAYFLAFGIAQLVYGPLADSLGRRPPLLAGLVIFIAGSVACALAPTIVWLSAGRFLQALGGAAVMVIPRAIIRDMHTGTAATHLMALVMLVISVSPMLAPLAGSGVIAISSWRAIFWLLALAAIASILLTVFLQPETLAPENRVPVKLRTLIGDAAILLRDPYFMGLTFIGALGMASFFVFIASAAFIYTGHYGLTPVGFSLAFAINALGFFSASQFAATLGERFGMEKTVAFAVAGFAAATALLLVLTLAGFGGLFVLIAMLIAANACLGLVIPASMVMALDDHGDRAGLASSLGGTLQMIVGGVMVVATGPFFDGTPLPMVATIAACGFAAWLLSRRILNRRAMQPEAAAGE